MKSERFYILHAYVMELRNSLKKIKVENSNVENEIIDIIPIEMTKLIIKKVRPSSFVGVEGTKIDYYWYKALRVADQVTIDFGSGTQYDVNEEIEVDLEKLELPGGKFRYKEPSNTR